MDQIEILKFLSDNKAELAKRFGVTRLGVVGSYARGEHSPESVKPIVKEQVMKDIKYV